MHVRGLLSTVPGTRSVPDGMWPVQSSVTLVAAGEPHEMTGLPACG